MILEVRYNHVYVITLSTHNASIQQPHDNLSSAWLVVCMYRRLREVRYNHVHVIALSTRNASIQQPHDNTSSA